MAEDAALVALVTVIIDKGAEAMPLISTALLIIVMWFYRKDGRDRHEQSRSDLIASTQAIERNTAALNNISQITKVRLENKP